MYMQDISCLPNKEMAPQVAQIMRQNPTDPASRSAMVGDTKIPDPAIRTTETQAFEGSKHVGA
jgi:hypothetical protein